MRLFELLYYALDVELRARLQFELFDTPYDGLLIELTGGLDRGLDDALYDGLHDGLYTAFRDELQAKLGNQS